MQTQGLMLQLSGHTHAGQIWPIGQLGQLTGIVEQNYGLKKLVTIILSLAQALQGGDIPLGQGDIRST